MAQRKFEDANVKAVFDRYPLKVRTRLLVLRALIYKTARHTEGVGALTETLKWGQPSYLTVQSKSGSTIRIDKLKAHEDKYAAYFHCQSGLVSLFQELYGDVLAFEGQRAIVFDLDRPFPEEAVSHCFGLALTHHLRKKTKKQAAA